MVRNTGTFTGEPGLGLGGGQFFPPNGAKLEGCPETFSLTFDSNKKLKYLTVGYVADRFQGNTKGNGAAVGIFNVIGLPFPSPGHFSSFCSGLVRRFSTKVHILIRPKTFPLGGRVKKRLRRVINRKYSL